MLNNEEKVKLNSPDTICILIYSEQKTINWHLCFIINILHTNKIIFNYLINVKFFTHTRLFFNIVIYKKSCVCLI